MITLALSLAAFAGMQASSSVGWSAGGDGNVAMTVAADFSWYNVTLGGTPWLHSAPAPVAVQCQGQRYQAPTNLTLTAPPRETEGGTAGVGAGPYRGYAAQWKAGTCTLLTTEVRYYTSNHAAFEFLTTVDEVCV